MTTHRIQYSALAAATVIALALSACDQSPSQRNAAVTPPRAAEPSSTMAPSTPSSAATPSSTDSQSTDKIAALTDDATVTTKVKTALMAEPGLRSMEIHVDTKDGVVTLTGMPDSSANRDRAVVIARNVTGVRDVIDQMASKSQS